MLKVKRPWRKNVLAILAIAYAVTAGIFVVLVFKMKMSAETAYDIIQAPFMTLIGGSLAIAKDLVGLDASDDKNNPTPAPTPTPTATPNGIGNGETKPGQEQ